MRTHILSFFEDVCIKTNLIELKKKPYKIRYMVLSKPNGTIQKCDTIRFLSIRLSENIFSLKFKLQRHIKPATHYFAYNPTLFNYFAYKSPTEQDTMQQVGHILGIVTESYLDQREEALFSHFFLRKFDGY